MANSTTTPRDSFLHGLRQQQNRTNYPLSSAGSFDFWQGDLLWFDSSVGYVKPLDSDAHAAYLAGVAIRNAYIAPYYSLQLQGGPGAVKNYCDSALVGFGDIYTFCTTAAESYSDGTAVYYGTDAQTITTVAGSHSIGVVKLQQGGTVTGAAGVVIPVLVIPQLPAQTL